MQKGEGLRASMPRILHKPELSREGLSARYIDDYSSRIMIAEIYNL